MRSGEKGKGVEQGPGFIIIDDDAIMGKSESIIVKYGRLKDTVANSISISAVAGLMQLNGQSAPEVDAASSLLEPLLALSKLAAQQQQQQQPAAAAAPQSFLM